LHDALGRHHGTLWSAILAANGRNVNLMLSAQVCAQDTALQDVVVAELERGGYRIVCLNLKPITHWPAM